MHYTGGENHLGADFRSLESLYQANGSVCVCVCVCVCVHVQVCWDGVWELSLHPFLTLREGENNVQKELRSSSKKDPKTTC